MHMLPMFHNNGQIITFFAPLYNSWINCNKHRKSSISIIFGIILVNINVTWTSIMASILSILLSIKKEKLNSSLKGIICGGQSFE